MPVDFVQSKIDQMNTSGATVSQETKDALYEIYDTGDDSFFGILKGYGKSLFGMKSTIINTFKFNRATIDFENTTLGGNLSKPHLFSNNFTVKFE
jgi:hypothetical protein